MADMATRFCGTCGTEVDEDASFCPSCGQPLDAAQPAGDPDATASIPQAPAWPEPPRGAEAAPADAAPMDSEPRPDEPAAPPPAEAPAPPPAAPPPPPAAQQAPPPAASVPPRPASGDGPQPGPQIDVPITWPVTLSGWLIGGGAVLAALGFLTDTIALRGAGAAMSVLFLLLMLGLAATVFFSASLPAVPHPRLITLGVAFAAVGIALDRLGFNAAGVGTLLVLVGAGAAAAGAVIVELGRDRPMSGPVGGGDRR